MKYKVLLFDADGTLFDFHKSEQVVFRQLLESLNVEDKYDEYSDIYHRVNSSIWHELEQGLISQEALKVERFNRFLQEVNLKENPIECASRFMDLLSKSSILLEGAYDLIKRLSEDYTIVIVTNGLREVQPRRVRNSILKPYVKATVISDEINIQKPNPRIIDYTLELIKHKNKEDVLMIGDRLQSDILVGINAGIDTVWYNPSNELNDTDINPTYEVKTFNQLFNLLK